MLTLKMWGLYITYFTGFVILGSVIYKFLSIAKQGSAKAEEKNCVDTMVMYIIILLMFPFINRNILPFEPQAYVNEFCFICGVLFLTGGAAWHVWAKVSLGRQWSDNIELKHEHKIITTGAYALSRHPMYGSLILWCLGAAFATFNLPALLITWLLFVPVLIYRAKAEEKLLSTQDGYEIYKNNVRMFFPSAKATLFKIVLLGVLTYAVVDGMTWGSLAFLFSIHLVMGYSLKPEKTAFSYRSKSGMMLVIFILSLVWQPFYYLYYLILAMFLYGLKWNCPCMLVYEKYHGCPCFALLNRSACKAKTE